MERLADELVEVMVDLADAATALDGEHGGRPAASSQGAAELDGQDGVFAGRSPWRDPIRDTHGLGGEALLVASDGLRAYACLAAGQPAPLFAHLVVARAVTEATVAASWLNQPGQAVTMEERARRGLVERYHAALQRRKVPELRPAADRLQEELKRIASALRWTLITGERDEDLCIGGTRRPPPIPGARELLTAGVDPAAAGMLWEHLSTVMHGSWHLGPAGGGGQARAAGLLHLYLQAAQDRADLMGWTTRPWEEARRRAGELTRQLLGTPTAGSPPTAG